MENTQLVIFKLDEEEFGVDILQVKEILKPQKIIKVPNAPLVIEGVINLRGEVYAVFNLRKKLQFPEKEFDGSTKMIIINIGGMDVSFVVDEVTEIIRVEEDKIKEPPELVTGVNRRYISAVAEIGERSIIILDLQLIMTETEQEELREFMQE